MIVNTDIENKGNLFPTHIVSYSKDVDSFYFTTTNQVVLKVTIIADNILRFHYGNTGQFVSDFSYAIDEKASRGFTSLTLMEDEKKYCITTSKLICYISKKDLRNKIYDALDGVLITQDELGFHWEESYEFGSDIVKMTKTSMDGECYYGLGDKPVHLNLKGKSFENWATDSYSFGKDTDPIYKAIPFYIGLHTKKAYGIFFDNTYKTFFDFCYERRNVTSFWAQGGDMDYYFIYGPKMNKVIANYTSLTGTPELPPLWSLGYHQSKWSYYPESKLKEIAEKFRYYQIPCDALYLDIDYMDGFRCFTWNKTYFPDLKKMVQELNADGFKTIVIIDPGIKIDENYTVFKEGLQNDYFCKRADGPYMKGKVWPGECYFPDFTNPKVRVWWSNLFKELVEEVGISGIWNDMNEPAVMEVPNKTFPDDVRHDFDGNPCSHRKAHNVYGMQMARATFEGVKRFSYPKRPFVITRSAYAGTQRYTSTWTGDNVASWEHLSIANIQAQRMSMSGFSFVGSDIGGFADRANGELFARWIQLGVFHPFCRAHSSGNHGDQEPWSFDLEITKIVKKFIELRYQLLPYLYTAFWQYINNKTPVLKPLVLFNQDDIQTHYRTDEFIFGDKILVCPILEPNATGRRMYIPEGNWYNYWTNERLLGGREYWVEAKIDSIPIFVLEGAIIPKYPIQQFVGELEITEITLELYFKNGKEDSLLYEDAHDGYEYSKGKYSLTTFTLIGKEKELILQRHQVGQFETFQKTFKLKFHGLPFEIKSIRLDYETLNVKALKSGEAKVLQVHKDFTEIHIIGK
jgi:alpha-glucosidase